MVGVGVGGRGCVILIFCEISGLYIEGEFVQTHTHLFCEISGLYIEGEFVSGCHSL